MRSNSVLKIQILFFSTYLFIFILNIIADIVYYMLTNNGNSVMSLKFIEISILISTEFTLLLLYKFTKLWKLGENSLHFFRLLITLIIIVIYSEFEYYSVDKENQDNMGNHMSLGIMIGFFMSNSFQNLDNFELNMGFFCCEMIYLIFSFNFLNFIHLQRLFTLTIVIIIYNKLRMFLQKNTKFKDKTIDQSRFGKVESDLLKTVFSEISEEALAIIDSNKNLLLNNEKMHNLNNMTVNLLKTLLSIRLRFVSMKSSDSEEHIELDKLDPLLQGKTSIKEYFLDFFKKEPENQLENILDKCVTANLNKKNDIIIKITFDLINSTDFGVSDDVSKHRLILSILFKNNKIQIFLIEILTIPDYSALLSSEKQSQNNKIFFVSHEMRTPLNCIVSMLQMLKPLIVEDLAEDYVAPAIISCNFLLYLVQDLLDMAQMESDKFTINYEEFDVRMLISDIIELFKIQAISKNAEIFSNISKLIPGMLKSDHRRIRQILINLIGNALKFLKKSHGKIAIEVSLNFDQPTYILFKVKDNGIGIKDEDKTKLFQAFGKINNEETKKMNSNGVGLGLMISNKLALNLHPTKSQGLQIESKYGIGTEFSFVIEDVNDATNLIEFPCNNNLCENYQNLLKKKEKTKFIKKEDTNFNIDMDNITKKTYSSMKLTIHNRFSVIQEFYQLTPLLRNNSNTDIIKENNQKVLKLRKSLKMSRNRSEKRLAYQNPSIQSFCDIFICKKDNDDYEASEKRMMIIKELNLVKSCKCSNILICDDNAFNIYSLRKQLEYFNFKIDCAIDGEEAIKMVEEYHNEDHCCKTYQIIFMDIEMPGINGYETTRKIREYYKKIGNNCNVKIVACSAHLNEEEHNKHKQFGMDEFVTKPIIKDRLIVLLAKFLPIIYDFNNSIV